MSGFGANTPHVRMTRADAGALRSYFSRWTLESDGDAFATVTSLIAPVRYRGLAAVLKIATVAEEIRGNQAMLWWNGRACAPVLEHDGPAILLQRAVGPRSLTALAESGEAGDAQATRILCETTNRLHSIDDSPGPESVSLTEWFAELLAPEPTSTGFRFRAAGLARELLDSQREQVVLHGDVHHANVLDFGADGWRAIDPKYLLGDRAFDFMNILCNPTPELALLPGRLSRHVDVIADATGIGRIRLLRWAVAWCGLSETWGAHEGKPPGLTLAVGLEAERLLGG